MYGEDAWATHIHRKLLEMCEVYHHSTIWKPIIAVAVPPTPSLDLNSRIDGTLDSISNLLSAIWARHRGWCDRNIQVVRLDVLNLVERNAGERDA